MDEVQGPSHDDAIARLEAKLREAVELLKPFALYGSFGGEDCYNVRVLSQDARAARAFLATMEKTDDKG